MKIVLATFAVIVVLGGLIIGLSETGLLWREKYEVKHQDISREVFEHTKSRVHGVTQDLADLYQEYQTADEKQKQGIASIVRMRFSNFDKGLINSPELRAFLVEMRGY